MDEKVELKKTVGQIYPPFSITEVNIVLDKDIIASGEPILGRYLKIKFRRRNVDCIGILRVIDVETENRSLANSEMAINANRIEGMRNKVRKRDVPIAKCEVLTAFEKVNGGYRRINLDTILHSLESLEFVSEDVIHEISNSIEQELFYLGKATDEEFDVPFVFRPFYILSEAYHMLIAGQTGSGKSTEAKKVLTAYLKSDSLYSELKEDYRRMSFLVLDPMGEFSKAFRNRDTGHFPLNMRQIWGNYGVDENIEIYTMDNIALSYSDMLKEVIEMEKLLEIIAIKHKDNRDYASDLITAYVKKETGISKMNKISAEDILELIKENITRIYTDEKKRVEIVYFIDNSDTREEFRNAWERVVEYFRTDTGKKTVKSIVWSLTSNEGKTAIMDLSSVDWSNPLKYMIIYSIFNELVISGVNKYKEGEMLNTLVVVDEAHRIAPPKAFIHTRDESDYRLKTREKVIYAFRETRKLGIGWLVISTRVSNLDQEIWEHARVRLFGFGLGTGKDAELIREQYGREILELYKQKIGDPYDLMSERKHGFMMDGPINLLSRKTPEFYTSYNTVDKFIDKNNLNKSRTDKKTKTKEFDELLSEI